MRTVLSAALLALLICCRRESVESTTVSTGVTATTTTSETTAPTETAAAEPVTSPSCGLVPNSLCPVDGGLSDPSFTAYRQQLLAAVRAKDEAKLVALVDPRIRTSFGDGGGIDAFRKSLDWTELEQILTMGGAFRGEGEARMFWAPYVYANWPEAMDPFQHVVAIHGKVPIRQTASESAPEVARAAWTILELLPVQKHDPEAAWRQVRTTDGNRKEGWVRAADVRSPIDYRAGFSKRSGEWKMEALVAGD